MGGRGERERIEGKWLVSGRGEREGKRRAAKTSNEARVKDRGKRRRGKERRELFESKWLCS